MLPNSDVLITHQQALQVTQVQTPFVPWNSAEQEVDPSSMVLVEQMDFATKGTDPASLLGHATEQ
jgi:hypothetical protein